MIVDNLNLKMIEEAKKRHNKTSIGLSIGLALIAVVLINILASQTRAGLDLTQEKRFTLTQPTLNLVKNLKDEVFVTVLLDGNFPSSFKRLQNATTQLLNDLHRLNNNIDFKLENPDITGTTEERQKKMKEYAEEGLTPTRLRLVDNDQKTEQYIFPYAIVRYRNRQTIVKLLENEVPGQNPEIVLNNSVSLLEYKFSNAIEKLLNNRRPNIFFSRGHGELDKTETADLEHSLAPFYNVGSFNLDSVIEIPFRDTAKIDIVIVAKPQTAFSEKEKFLIDQYVMQGGKIIWLIDKLDVDLAAMQKTGKYIPIERQLNLDDLLFKYGFRIQPNLILDLECARIPMRVGAIGTQPQLELFPWYYYPIMSPSSDHPIVKSLDRVWLQFPSSLDTLKTKIATKKTILLASSTKSRLQYVPTELNFEFLRYPVEPEKFNKGSQPVAAIAEGNFSSLFAGRVSAEQMGVLQKLGLNFLDESKPTKMLVVSDGDIARNEYDTRKNALLPLGYNRFENYKFANKDFLLNSVEYLLDQNGIIEARSKEIKLRLLNTTKVKAETSFWRTLNIGLPIVLLLIAGFVTYYLRRKKYQLN